jgi:hypothetical protein
MKSLIVNTIVATIILGLIGFGLIWKFNSEPIQKVNHSVFDNENYVVNSLNFEANKKDAPFDVELINGRLEFINNKAQRRDIDREMKKPCATDTEVSNLNKIVDSTVKMVWFVLFVGVLIIVIKSVCLIKKYLPILFVLVIPLGYFGFVIYQIFQ